MGIKSKSVKERPFVRCVAQSGRREGVGQRECGYVYTCKSPHQAVAQFTGEVNMERLVHLHGAVSVSHCIPDYIINIILKSRLLNTTCRIDMGNTSASQRIEIELKSFNKFQRKKK